MAGENVLLIADIEGSSGCFDYEGSSFKTEKWASACADMTKDVDAVVRALFETGARRVTVKDFHRTGYNLFTDLIDPRARIFSGYRNGPVPGIGDPAGHDTAMFIGMHAPSGSGGFLAHTMTHRITSVCANGKSVSELELFAGSLAPFGIRPVFFSGCPVACAHAEKSIPGLRIYPIDKSSASFDAKLWREQCAVNAAAALINGETFPYNPEGPFEIELSFKGGNEEAGKIARIWNLRLKSDRVTFSVSGMPELFSRLIDIAYFSPVTRAVAPFALPFYNMYGRSGIRWARKKLCAARKSQYIVY